MPDDEVQLLQICCPSGLQPLFVALIDIIILKNVQQHFLGYLVLLLQGHRDELLTIYFGQTPGLFLFLREIIRL